VDYRALVCGEFKRGADERSRFRIYQFRLQSLGRDAEAAGEIGDAGFLQVEATLKAGKPHHTVGRNLMNSLVSASRW
jgi:hypothetical protein